MQAHYYSGSGSASELHQNSEKWAVGRETSSERRPHKQELPDKTIGNSQNLAANGQSKLISQTLSEYTDRLDTKPTTQLTTAQNSERQKSAYVGPGGGGIKGGRSSIQSQKPPTSASANFANQNNSQKINQNTQIQQRTVTMNGSQSTAVLQNRIPAAPRPQPGQRQQPGQKDETQTYLDKNQKDRIGKLQNDVRKTWRGVKPD